MTVSPAANDPRRDGAADRTYRAGTLSYNRAGLVSLFGWLLWGDFVFTFMDSVSPNLLPLLLRAHGATDQQIVIIVSTLAMAVNAVLNPIISYNSDRFRSRWGRRRPFIMVSTPFVVCFLAAIPFAPKILRLPGVAGLLAGGFGWSGAPPLILLFGMLVAGFQGFNTFMASVYYYLIPDVVPQEFLGRFYGLFRVFGLSAGVGFHYFVFGHAKNHMQVIFMSVALAYGFFILLMCWNVKEGDYPPPAREPHGHWWNGVENYLRECFGNPYYWLVFLTYSTGTWAGVSNVFGVFFYGDEMGISLDLIGKMLASSGVVLLLLAYPCGIVVDRWGCHKALILGFALNALCTVLMFCFSFGARSTIAWALFRTLPGALSGMALLKWQAEVYPRDRYGQFGSAGALFASLGGIALGPVCGWWIGRAGHYSYFLLWNAFFTALGAVAASAVHTRWKGFGGPDNYRPPQPEPAPNGPTALAPLD